MTTLAEAISVEIKRNTELVKLYKSIGPNGAFGAAMIQQDIDAAIKAWAKGDVAAMISACATLQENQA